MNSLQRLSAICFLCFIPLLFTSGCASIVTGQNQPLSVQTRDGQGKQVTHASCQLVNDRATYFVDTPGTVVVQRSYNDLLVTCKKDEMEPGTATVRSSTKAMTAGNCCLGGVIGIAVDSGTGAAFDYPSMITVIMGQSIEIGTPPPPPPSSPSSTEGTR